MKEKEEHFYLVRKDVLPEAMKKTIDAKLMLERGQVNSIAEAVSAVDLSRSAFYKYRDAVFPFSTMVKEQIVTLFIEIQDRSGTLSRLLTEIAATGCNVLTIHQNIPLQDRANVTMAINTKGSQKDLPALIDGLAELDFVERIEVLGTGA